jgi:hypothetical protein
MITKSEAISSLRPEAQWVMYDDNVESIIWQTTATEPLTTAEVEAEVKKLEKAAIDKVKADQAATAAAIAHAKTLGFTDAMIAVMYPNLGA